MYQKNNYDDSVYINNRPDYNRRYNEIKDKFTQQDTPIRDSNGRRWCQCVICKEIKEESLFSSFGGLGMENSGECRKCSRNSRKT